jgi:hypothetical protein
MLNDQIAFGDFCIQQSNTQTGTTRTTRLLIDANGNVGIGTNSPQTLLQLQKANGTGSILLRMQNDSVDGYSGTHLYGSDNFIKGHFGWANTSAGTLADKMYFGTIAAKDVVFTSNDTERMRITSGGNVGIGTSSPIAKTEIRGNGNTAINSAGTLFVTTGGTATQAAEAGGQLTFGAWLNGDLSVPYPVAAIKGVSESSTTDINKGALIFATMNNTTNAERMRITSGGNVGIGTSSPASYTLLDVNGQSIFRGNPIITSGNALKFNNYYNSGTVSDRAVATGFAGQIYFDSGSGYISFQNSASSVSADTNTTISERMRITSGGEIQSSGDLKFNSANTVYNASGDFYVRASTHLQLGAGGTNSLMTIFNNGNVAIGTSDIGYKLTLNGQPGANGYTAWTNYSDSRLKENVTDFDATNVLDKICAIRPVTYNYNELSGFDEETRARRISGFIAQELMQVFPDMVGTIKKDDVEYYDTNLSNLNLYLVKAIQEQTQIIKDLEERIVALESK